jgi:hypothetical protein
VTWFPSRITTSTRWGWGGAGGAAGPDADPTVGAMNPSDRAAAPKANKPLRRMNPRSTQNHERA